ncbi:MAG: hypothetical protein E6I37_15350 [Chloroflexi bacterium]|nr:MAG: hypothetical protein E6I37_15350 [Chloroflexota bacterium]
MNDYYSLYTWAMDRHAQLERQATERRLVRAGRFARYATTHAASRLRWPLGRRRDERKAA